MSQIQTGLNLCDALQRQNSVNGMLQECTKSHKARRHVAATCRRDVLQRLVAQCVLTFRHKAKLLCVAQIQTGLNLCDALQRQNSVNGMLQECTKSHKATCRSYMLPRRVTATCRLVCPDLQTRRTTFYPNKNCFLTFGFQICKLRNFTRLSCCVHQYLTLRAVSLSAQGLACEQAHQVCYSCKYLGAGSRRAKRTGERNGVRKSPILLPGSLRSPTSTAKILAQINRANTTH